jgi:hypothetical protein
VKQSLRYGDQAAAQRGAAGLRAELENHPAVDRGAERVFIGSLLADMEPTQPELGAYVKEFQQTVYGQTLAQLGSATLADKLKPGEPYIVGSSAFTAADLMKVNPARVEKVTLNRRTYRKVWVGSVLIIVPQSAENYSFLDPTGLGLSDDWVAAGNNAALFSKRIVALNYKDERDQRN